MRRSTMFLRRYFSLSNSTSRASRSSFSFEGITGVISMSVSISSIQFARYPLSPAIAIGHATALPLLAVNSTSVPLSRSTREVFSWACPAVISKCSGKPLASQIRCIFVEKPPRDRPRAWSSGSCGSLFFHRRWHIWRLLQWCRRCTKVQSQFHLRQ